MKPAGVLRLLSFFFLSAALAQAAPPPVPPGAALPGEATLRADTVTLDLPADSYRAQGSVRLVQDGLSLLADSVVYRRNSADVLAEGGVLLTRDDVTLKGDRFSLNLASKKGEMTDGELFVAKTNFRVRGRVMEKTGDEDYLIERGIFTTCDGEKPSWRFEAKKVEITLGEFATARDAVFYAGNLPLFYTPYLLFPVKTEKESGLLIPKFGHSTKKGTFYSQPYYWVIDPGKDLTFNLDLESARGAGVGGDFRYLRPRGGEGRLQWFGIYDTEAGKLRGEIDQKHLELLSPDTTVTSEIHLIADRAYYKDYGELSGDYNRQMLESTAAFDHRWQRYGLTGELRYSQDLVAANNDATLQRLPALGFTAAGERIGPFFWSMDSGATGFQRTAGTNGERLELHPRLALYAKPVPSLDLSLYGGYRQRLYNAYGGDTRPGFRQLGEADAGGTLSLPLERVYDGRLRHLLIPSLEYGFVQEKDQESLPLFDYGDRVLGQSLARWSVANVLTGKSVDSGGEAQYRELVYLKLSQGYQLSGERRDLLTLVDRHHHLTDLMLESRVSPLPFATVDLDGRYNPVDHYLSTGNLAVELKGEGSTLAHLGYRFSRGELDYLEGRFSFPLSRRFTATMTGRYSFDRGTFLESRYALEYRHQCWSVVVAYADRPGIPDAPGNISNSGNKEFTVNFSLFGIGALSPVRAF